jgi:hypothetical protein
MDKDTYVRITVGHYRGKVGIVDTRPANVLPGNIVVLFATPPEHCKGASLPRSFVEVVSRKDYFVDKIQGYRGREYE